MFIRHWDVWVFQNQNYKTFLKKRDVWSGGMYWIEVRCTFTHRYPTGLSLSYWGQLPTGTPRGVACLIEVSYPQVPHGAWPVLLRSVTHRYPTGRGLSYRGQCVPFSQVPHGAWPVLSRLVCTFSHRYPTGRGLSYRGRGGCKLSDVTTGTHTTYTLLLYTIICP